MDAVRIVVKAARFNEGVTPNQPEKTVRKTV